MKSIILICSLLLAAQVNMAQETLLGWGSTDIRYPQADKPQPAKAALWKGKAWKGERVNAQAVLWTANGLKGVSVSVNDLKNGAAVIPSSAITANFAGYVKTDELSKDGSTGCGHRPDPTKWDSSMVADLLMDAKTIDIKARSAQPVWLNIRVPEGSKAGIYKGTLTVTAEGVKPMQLQVEVNVLNHTLPAPREWPFHLDLWQNPYAVARYYGVSLWSKAHFDAMRPLMKRLADAGQKGITCSIMHKPWAGQTYDHFDSMIGRIKMLDGRWAYDYTVFDRWVEFMMNEAGIDQYIYCYTMIPWALSFDYYDQATARVQFVNAKPGEEAYAGYWEPFLKDFARHLRQKGWFDKTMIAMDERGLDAMKEAIKVIRKADPDYKISLAGNYHGEIQHELFDLCIAYHQSFPPEVMAERKKAGKISSVYTCCSEPRPNTFTFSPTAEAAWLGWHAAAGNYDGYLRWAFNSWPEDPLHDSRFRTWAGGDTYLVYPGNQSSIRFERLIEGIQDYEKIRVLRREFEARKDTKKLNKLNKAVAEFAADRITPDNAADMVNEARRVLNSF